VAESSFDAVVQTDRQEIDNALRQAQKELTQRFDFKGTEASITWAADEVVVGANTEERAAAALDLFQEKLVKRGVSLKALSVSDPKPGARGHVKVTIGFVDGIPADKAKELVKVLKRSKLKVQVAVQEDQLRVTGKSKDDLQQAQSLLRDNDQGLPLRFQNYR